MTYIPNEKQIEAHCAMERFIGYGGAMGGGKTRWLCEMALLLSVKFPGNFGLIARQSGPALKLSTQEVFFDEVLIPGSKQWKTLGAKFNKSEGLLLLRALDPPSKVWFTGLDSDNVERVKSLNLGFFGIDEATEVAEAIFMMLCTRLRRKGIPKEFRKGMISANPEAGWVKRRFLDQNLGDHVFVEANYTDNPHLPEDYPELFNAMPNHWREKYLLGNWGAVSGLVLKDFDPEVHIIPYKEAFPEWRRFRGFDHGQQNPAACIGFTQGYVDEVYLPELIGDRMDFLDKKYDNYPVIIADKMYYSSGLVSDHKVGIAKTFEGIDRVGITYADPSIWRKDREKIVGDGKGIPFSIAQEYMENPNALTGLVRANNIVAVGIDRLSMLLRIGHLYFMDHESMDPLVGETGEIRSYSWKQPRTDDDDWPEEPIKRNDHACDAARYGIMSLPPLKAEQAKVIPYNSFMAARQRAIADKKGKRGITIAHGRVVGI